MSKMVDAQDVSNNHDDDEGEEFLQGIEAVYDAFVPGLTSPQDGETIPTHLIPYASLRSSSFRSSTEKQ